MTKQEAMPRGFQALVNALLNGSITAQGLQQMERWLDGNFALQCQFRRYCQLHIDLDTDARSQLIIDEVSRCLSSLHGDLSSRSSNKAVSEAPRMLARHPSIAFALGLAICLILALSIIILTNVRSHPYVPTSAIPEARYDAEGQDLITVLLKSNECKILPIGDIGTVFIQGPAHFELIGSRRARLHQGRIKVRITNERGHGFVVETPRGHVTDLGTEFGVDVDRNSRTGIVVFEGEVDLTLPTRQAHGALHVERLIQGDGLSLQYPGRLDRIMSIVTGNVATFQRLEELSQTAATITEVSDNIRSSGFKKFYEIVPRGLREDALAYADRPAHDWNGIDQDGMPNYLVGADYVKPFNSDKMRGDVEIQVAISRPARLFVFFDDRVPPPKWLTSGFRDTGDDLGLDLGKYVIDGVKYYRADRGVGAGISVDDTFSIWEQIVTKPETVRLGPNLGESEFTAMYAIAAIPLE